MLVLINGSLRPATTCLLLIAPQFLLLQLMGCQLFDDNKAASPRYYEEIYVPLFAGDPICRKESTNYFVLKLSSEIDSWIIEGDHPQCSEAEELGSAKGRGASILILGYIQADEHPNACGSVTLSVYDVGSRKLIEEFHERCDYLGPVGDCTCANSSIRGSVHRIGSYLRYRD